MVTRYAAAARRRGSGARRRAASGVLAAALLLFAASSILRHHAALQRQHALSSCPARLAALGLDLDAASLDRAHFAGADSWQQALARRQLYDTMANDVQLKGLQLGGVITQGLGQQELFQRLPAPGRWATPRIQPILHALDVPVRAVVLPLLDDEAAMALHMAVRGALQPLLSEDSMWMQDPAILHSTLFHASSHTHPVPATAQQVQQEAAAVSSAAASTCPIRAMLDRVVVTASGVIVACWQVLPGSGEPAALRQALRTALPHAPPPQDQAVTQPAMLHTTVARLLAPALHAAPPAHADIGSAPAGETAQAWQLPALQRTLVAAVADVSDELCGLAAAFDQVWFVEEAELLALALAGRYSVRASTRLACGQATAVAG